MSNEETVAWELSTDGSIYHFGVLLDASAVYEAIVALESDIERLEAELKLCRHMFRPIISEKSAERIADAVLDNLGGKQP